MAKKATAEEVIAKLAEVGVTTESGITNANGVEIPAITADESVEELQKVLNLATEKPKKASKNSVSVQFNGGVREFSKEIHGDDFEDLAKQFADKHKGTIL